MTALPGFELVLPDGTTFSGRGDLRVTMMTLSEFLVGGQGGGGMIESSVAYFGDYVDGGGQTGRADGINQNIAVLPHASHVVQIGFNKWEGETGESWGGAADGDGAIVKLQVLDRALNTTRIDSMNVAELSVGEYSSGGQFDPLPVFLGEVELTFDATEQSSDFRGSLSLVESADLSTTIDTVT